MEWRDATRVRSIGIGSDSNQLLDDCRLFARIPMCRARPAIRGAVQRRCAATIARGDGTQQRPEITAPSCHNFDRTFSASAFSMAMACVKSGKPVTRTMNDTSPFFTMRLVRKPGVPPAIVL